MDSNFNPEWNRLFAKAMLKLQTMQMEEQAKWKSQEPKAPPAPQVPQAPDVQQIVQKAMPDNNQQVNYA